MLMKFLFYLFIFQMEAILLPEGWLSLIMSNNKELWTVFYCVVLLLDTEKEIFILL